ncbi:MAG: ABC transporter permease [Propioniciclava sp.]|uniref:ABC transporter permease n=1 Tax=Propioniciclava sp. TaxID=2038686 RepID=UPI0039E28528
MTIQTATRPVVPTRPSTAARRFAALVRAETTILLRNKTAVFTAVALPFMMAFAFSGMALDPVSLGILLSTILLGTGLLFVVYYTMVTSLVGRREQLVLKRLLAGEPTRWEILLAPAVPLWVLLVVQAGVGVGAAVFWFDAPMTHPWALVLAVAGGASAWTALAIWSATWTRTVESAQLTTMPLMLVSILLSGFSIPLSALPAPAETAAHWLPMAPVVDLLTFAFTGMGLGGTPVTGPAEILAAAATMLAPLVLWTALGLWAGLRSFRWDARS